MKMRKLNSEAEEMGAIADRDSGREKKRTGRRRN